MKIPKTNIDDNIIFNNRIFQTIQLIALISILFTGNSYADEDHHEQLKSADISDYDEISHEHNGGLSVLSKLLVPMGIVTLSLVAVTVFLSIFRRINTRLMMTWHKRTGMTALITGAIHAVLVLIAH